VPTGLHEDEVLAPRENGLPPEPLEAKVESFFLTFGLPQTGQVTSEVALALRSSSSKDWLQVVQVNSKRGIVSPENRFLSLDEDTHERLHVRIV
jgi:hypothetical protein